MATHKNDFESEMQQILAAISITSPSILSFGGETVPVEKPASQAASAMAQNSPIVTALQHRLYQRCYCNAFGTTGLAQQGETFGPEQFAKQLSEANQSRARWDGNWVVKRVETTGHVWAEKRGVLRTFQPGEFMNYEGAGTPVRIGGSINAYLFRESTTVQPGMYFAFGETAAASDNLDIFRLYWNIDVRGVLQLLPLVCRDLNRFQIPFQFKSPVWPQGYMRRDAGVLYVKKTFYPIVRDLAEKWASECKPHMRDDVPLFTLPLARGVGLAEDPETGESFGMHRCRYVAEGVWKAHTAEQSQNKWLQAVKDQFQQHGLDFKRPYLKAGSVDLYSPMN